VSAARQRKILFVNTYLQGREQDCDKGLYPRSHLWGIDHLRRAGYEVVVVPAKGTDWLSRLAARLSRWTRNRFGDLDQELQILRRLRGADIIYIAFGNLFWTVWLRALGLIRPRILNWVYVPLGRTTRLSFLTTNRFFLRGYDGFLCLTKLAAHSYAQAAPQAVTRHVAWGADTALFCAGPEERTGEFFFACGRTNRDYRTLFRAADKVHFPIKVLVSPWYLKGLGIPANVEVVSGPQNPDTDQGITYLQLVRDYYAPARAILISRIPDPNDTNGFTNLLEALAVGKPVIMTRTGSLDIDIEAEGVGLHVEPNDADGWVKAMQKLIDDPDLARQMGRRARQLTENFYNLDRFGRDLVDYFAQIESPNR
jgi:glycosyltransferase involved in cell wall biosynthesis